MAHIVHAYFGVSDRFLLDKNGYFSVSHRGRNEIKNSIGVHVYALICQYCVNIMRISMSLPQVAALQHQAKWFLLLRLYSCLLPTASKTKQLNYWEAACQTQNLSASQICMLKVDVLCMLATTNACTPCMSMVCKSMCNCSAAAKLFSITNMHN